MTVLRTSQEGCWELTTNTWGTFLSPTRDPLADTVITQEQLQGFELKPNTPRIPYALWDKWIQLCIELTKRNSSNLEVSCRLLRHQDDSSRYRIFVPEQRVTGVSVRVDTFDKAVDIETGEVVSQWPPEGWRPCGSSHSHNTMDAFFSGTDDQYELGDPGLHIVVGKINVTNNEYVLEASVTANKRRFIIDPNDVVELDSDTAQTATYHPAVLDVITLPSARTFNSNSYSSAFNRRSSTWSAPLAYTSSKAAVSLLDNEMMLVLTQVDHLITVAKDRQISINDVLRELIEEIECLNDMEDLMPSTTDPFYWSTY